MQRKCQIICDTTDIQQEGLKWGKDKPLGATVSGKPHQTGKQKKKKIHPVTKDQTEN
jgi:hypothetical protein